MTIKVYHLNIDTFLNEARNDFIDDAARRIHTDLSMFGKSQSFTKSWFEAHFNFVAIVDTDDMNVVFEKTNHIESSWTENEEISWSAKKVRSTSCGDLLQLQDGTFYMVAGCGFEPVNVG